MKKCKACNSKIEDDCIYCPICGTKIEEPAYESYPHKKKRKGIVVTIIVCFVAAAVCITLLILNKKIFSYDHRIDTAKSAAGLTQAPEPVAMAASTATPEPAAVSESTAVSEPTATPEPTSAPEVYAASDIVASLVAKDFADTSELMDAPVLSAKATSVIDQENINNSPMCAFDNDTQTNWQEGVDGPGIGQGITAHFDGNVKVSCMLFKLGNWKDAKNFYGNNRPSKLGITIGDFSTEIEFPTSWEEFCVELNHPYAADSITFTIDDVYQGTSWDDTAISDIRILCVKE